MWRNRAAAPDDHANVTGIVLAQHVHHVAEVLVVAALVGTDGDAVGVLLDRRADDVGNAAVVTEMHDLGTVRLEKAPDDVDRGIVPVEQRRGAHETQRRRLVPLAGLRSRRAGRRSCVHACVPFIAQLTQGPSLQ